MYRTDSGSIKYEAVFSVRVRFNIESENLNDAYSIANVIAGQARKHIVESEELNVPTGPASANLPFGEPAKTNITMAVETVEGVDYANKRAGTPTVWNLGQYITNSTLAHRWNTRLRHLKKSDDNSQYARFDTNEGYEGYSMPSLPVKMLNGLVNTRSVVVDTQAIVDDTILSSVLPELEGLYEDDVLDAALKEEQPETEVVL